MAPRRSVIYRTAHTLGACCNAKAAACDVRVASRVSTVRRARADVRREAVREALRREALQRIHALLSFRLVTSLSGRPRVASASLFLYRQHHDMLASSVLLPRAPRAPRSCSGARSFCAGAAGRGPAGSPSLPELRRRSIAASAAAADAGGPENRQLVRVRRGLRGGWLHRLLRLRQPRALSRPPLPPPGRRRSCPCRPRATFCRTC